jgi:hypothetical protein
MRTLVFLTLLAGSLPGATDPWIGAWKVVWASASHDNPSRLTVSRTADGLQLNEQGKPAQKLRAVDATATEYTLQLKTHVHNIRFSSGPDGRELTITTRCPQNPGPSVALYDRIDVSVEDGSPAGVWIFDSAKSSPGTPPRVFEAVEGGKLRFGLSEAEPAYTAAFDGKDYPLTGNAGTRTVSLKRIDYRTFEESLRDAEGKEVQVRRVAVSEDGNEMKITHTGMFPAGRGHRMLILRKQR